MSDTSVFPAFRNPPSEAHRQRPVHDEYSEQVEQRPQQTSPQPVEAAVVSPPATDVAEAQPAQYPSQEVLALQQAEQARQQMVDLYNKQQQQLTRLQQENEQFRLAQQRAQLASSVPEDYFSSLASIDEADARKLNEASVSTVQAAIAPLQKELEQTRQWVAQRDAYNQQQMEQARINRLTQEVLVAHPDFYQLVQTPQYQSFMNQRDGLSSQTRDQRAADEFRAGNTAYVIDMLKRFKEGNQTASAIQTVAPVQATSSWVNPSQQNGQPPTLTLRELNNLYQMGQINHNDYVAEAKRIRAAI